MNKVESWAKLAKLSLLQNSVQIYHQAQVVP